MAFFKRCLDMNSVDGIHAEAIFEADDPVSLRKAPPRRD
jgi:hypothetical protein